MRSYSGAVQNVDAKSGSQIGHTRTFGYKP